MVVVMSEKFNRIAIIGVSGSGKSTLARKLAANYSLPLVELDKFLFDEQGQKRNTDLFLADVKKAVSGKQWIVEGISYKMADLVWPKADFVIWLDLPLRTMWPRVFWRSLQRLITRGSMPSGHPVKFSSEFGRHGIVRNLHKIYANIHDQYPKHFDKAEKGKVNLIRINSRKELDRWLESLE